MALGVVGAVFASAAKAVALVVVGLMHLAGIVGSSLGPILGPFVDLVIGFFQGIAGDIEGFIGSITTTLTLGFSQILLGWTSSFGPYGVWIPVMLVMSIAASALVLFFFADVIGLEREVLDVENIL